MRLQFLTAAVTTGLLLSGCAGTTTPDAAGDGDAAAAGDGTGGGAAVEDDTAEDGEAVAGDAFDDHEPPPIDVDLPVNTYTVADDANDVCREPIGSTFVCLGEHPEYPFDVDGAYLHLTHRDLIVQYHTPEPPPTQLTTEEHMSEAGLEPSLSWEEIRIEVRPPDSYYATVTWIDTSRIGADLILSDDQPNPWITGDRACQEATGVRDGHWFTFHLPLHCLPPQTTFRMRGDNAEEFTVRVFLGGSVRSDEIPKDVSRFRDLVPTFDDLEVPPAR